MDSIDTAYAPDLTSHLGLHEPFLEWSARGDDMTLGDIGLGAFLSLRLADQFGAEAYGCSRAALEYQCSATRSFVEGIHPKSKHSAMLCELVRVAEAALESDEPRMLFSPLLAFAFSLEREACINEALDVLETALHLSDGWDREEEIATLLHLGRVLRNMGRLGDARLAYQRAGTAAARIPDNHSELLSRIGLGVVARFVGNLPESEKILRAVIAEACECDDRDAEAKACHDLAGTLHFAGRAANAVPLTFRAYELYDSQLQKAKALSDTGAILKELGQYGAAKHALSLVLSNDLPPDVRARAELECLDLAALTGDRLSFERFRQSLAAQNGALLPEVQLDFELKVGVGLSQFEEHQQGEAHLRRAVELAEFLCMSERLFFAEQQLEEVRQRRIRPPQIPTGATADANGFQPLQETVARLEVLAVCQQG